MKVRVTAGLFAPILILASALNASHAAPIIFIGDVAGVLGTVDVDTGDVTVIGDMGVVMTDIAFDPNGNLFGIDFDNLYAINSTTAEIALIGPTFSGISLSLNSLVFSSAGTLYAANTSLHTLDPLTGASTLVGNGGDAYDSSGDLAFINGGLYLSSTTLSADDLFLLDESTGAGTRIGSLGACCFFGLATDNNIDLFGVAGPQVLSVDVNTGAAALLLNYAGHGLTFANGSAFISEAVIPIPAAAWLFCSGLLLFMPWVKRKAM